MNSSEDSNVIPESVAFPKMSPGEKSVEHLSHFWCPSCKKWWSIGDAPADKQEWYCPWCGIKHIFKNVVC